MMRKATMLIVMFYLFLSAPMYVFAATLEERLVKLESFAMKLQSEIADLKKDIASSQKQMTPVSFIPKTSTGENKIVPNEKKYKYGFDMHIYALNEDYVIESFKLPDAHISSFRADTSDFDMESIAKRAKFNIFTLNTMWQGIGYLSVHEEGQYTVTLTVGFNAYVEIYIDDQLFTKKYARTRSTVFAAENLDKGLHKVDFRIYNGVERDMRVSRLVTDFSKFRVDVKTPDAFQAQPAHRVLSVEQ